MIEAAILASGVLGVFALCFIAGAVLFLYRINRADSPPPCPVDTPLPRVAVLLCLRGVRAELPECLEALFNQDYPCYELKLVIDSEADSAWPVVEKMTSALLRPVNVTMEPLRERLETCSLKCSALLQMVRQLDQDVEIIAFVDDDVVPHSSWLRELVIPLLDEKTGATFGIPWDTPRTGGWTTIIRKVWFMPSAVLMALCGWGWGGTSAIRVQALFAAGIPDLWARSLSSDGPISGALRAIGLRNTWVPSLVIAQLQECDVRFLWQQLVRYRLALRSFSTSRVYLSGWNLFAIAVIVLVFALILTMGMTTISLMAGDLDVLVVVGGALGAYFSILAILMLLVEYHARAALRRNHACVTNLNGSMLVRMLVGIPVAHALHGVATMLVPFLRNVTWNDITYRTEGPWKIRVRDDRSTTIPSQR